MFSNELIKCYPEAINFLTNAVKKNRLASSYILVGKNPDGLLPVVISLAKILNCKKRDKATFNPCNNCINCRWLDKKEHPQALWIINPDSNGKKDQIKIDTIREILNSLSNTSEFYRIIYFQNSNLYTFPPECCNLLLKIVEEAKEQILFIFGNKDKNDILPTILSRSQILYLNKKINTIQEAVNPEQPIHLSEELQNLLSKSISQNLQKAKNALDVINKNELDLKDYFLSLASISYESKKFKNPASFKPLLENINSSYLKYKSFVQPKIILEDFYLNPWPE